MMEPMKPNVTHVTDAAGVARCKVVYNQDHDNPMWTVWREPEGEERGVMPLWSRASNGRYSKRKHALKRAKRYVLKELDNG